MAILNNSNAISSGGYDINNSLRFRSSASARLSRTFGTTGTNNKIQTLSVWVKRGLLSGSTIYRLMGCYDGSSANSTEINFTNDNLKVEFGGAANNALTATQVFRDPSAWYHIVIAIDTTQATASNRVKMYVNGTQVTAFTTANYPAQNAASQLTSANANNSIGSGWSGFEYFDGYMADFNFIDGQALTPSSFGETDTTTGSWKPKAYTGTYGTNGFYLKFSDIATTSGSNAGLGKDFSGNTNYWTTNNISVTAGTTYDAMTDVPTNTSATVANYATWNGVAIGIDATLSSGNLNIAYGTASTRTGTAATMGMSSGKYYWEISTITQSGTFEPLIGITNSTLNSSTSSGIGIYPGYTANGWGYDAADGTKYTNGTGSAYGATWTSSDVIGVAFDADNGTLTFYKNNVSQGTAFTGLTSGPYFPAIGDGSTAGTFTIAVNFGQRLFAYTPPTGYVALNTFNLPDSTIVKGNTVMDATLYTGTGSGTLTVTNAALFKPDLVWAKCRNTASQNHVLVDSVRGASIVLSSNLTDAEFAVSSINPFNSNGFGANGVVNNAYSQNVSGQTYVAWQWQAGQGSTSSNTSGSITSTVSVNTTAGFSIVTFTGTGTTSTIGHGLGVAPKMIIVKQRSAANNWDVYHASLGNTAAIFLNATNAAVTNSAYWNNTSPTSTVFTLSGSNADVNVNGVIDVAYCWAAISGYSAFGNYTGNGSTDGSFVYTGFLPRFVMIKRTDTTGDWYMWDTARNTYDVITNTLLANSSAAETSATSIDALSNGFKLRNTTAGFNANGGTYIYAAFASNPFRNSNAF